MSSEEIIEYIRNKASKLDAKRFEEILDTSSKIEDPTTRLIKIKKFCTNEAMRKAIFIKTLDFKEYASINPYMEEKTCDKLAEMIQKINEFRPVRQEVNYVSKAKGNNQIG